MSGSGTGIVTPYSTHRGIDGDPATFDCFVRAAGLTGVVNGQLGIVSVWWRVDAGNNTWRVILGGTANRVLIVVTNANQFSINVPRPGGGPGIVLTTTPTYLAGSGWHHTLASWDTTVPVAQIYIDGAVPALAVNTVNAVVLGYVAAGWSYMASVVPNLYFNGAASEGYVNLAETIDITVQANRDLWRHPNGQPPNLGADGSGPTGTQPALYMVEEGGTIVNRGSGGAFIVNPGSAPALSADSPKDRWVASLIRGMLRRRRR